MQEIKLYFAGDAHIPQRLHTNRGGEGCPPLFPMLKQTGIKNRLVSYVYKRQFNEWITFMEKFPGNMLIDSGAFSAWNKREQLDISNYIEYCHECIEIAAKNNQAIRVVNLDVIPGSKGQTKELNKFIGCAKKIQQNKQLIEEAARQGYRNLKLMTSEGITPIHVFHQGEHFKWLDRMVEYTDYIGISPANDMPTDSKIKWIESVFTYLYTNNINIKTHGFAVLIIPVLKEFPWTSCDAASWKLSAAYGNIFYPNGGFTNPDFSKGGNVLTVSRQQKTKKQTLLWQQLEKEGYSYEMLQDYFVRSLVNIRYVIALEKWLNTYKKDKQFIPKIKLL